MSATRTVQSARVPVSRIAFWRKKAGLRQKDLSDHFGVTISTIKNLEAGQGIEQFAKIIRACKVLDCTPENLIEKGFKSIREEQKKTQKEVANAIEISLNTLQNWEKKSIDEKIKNQLDLCAYLKCELKDLVSFEPIDAQIQLSDIQELRQQQKLSQQELADQVRISVKTLEQWEKGQNTEQILRIFRLCDALQCDISDLVKIPRR